MTSLLLAGLIGRTQISEIVLQRGREVVPLTGEEPYRYWSCEDATLDSSDKDGSHGGDSNLVSGPAFTFAIQFRDLNVALGPTAKIKSASLTLGLIQGTPQLGYVRWIKKPWTEGPLKSLMGLLRGGEDPTGAVSWRSRRIGSIPWASVGALGDADSEKIEGLSLVKENDLTYRIEGLGPTMQRQLLRPAEMHGLVINFSSDVDFLSSNASIDRPKLVLQVEKGEPVRGADLSVTMIRRTPEYPLTGAKTGPAVGDQLTYTAHIKSVGAADAPAFDAQWIVDDGATDIVSVSEGLTVGSETQLSIKLPARPNLTDHRSHTVALRIFPKGADVCRGNNLLEVAANGKSVEVVASPADRTKFASQINALGSFGLEDWVQTQLGLINESLFRYSRFSFAPNGVLERLRLQRISDAPSDTCDVTINLGDIVSPKIGFDRVFAILVLKKLGLVPFPHSGERFPGIFGYGDTRAEVNLTSVATMADEPLYDPLADQELLEKTGLLSATDVGALNSNVLFRGGPSDYLFDLPTVLLRIGDNAGNLLLDSTVTITQVSEGAESAPIYQGKITSEPFYLPSQKIEVTENPLTGRKLGPNPFGKIDLSGKNGQLKLKVERFGASRVFSVNLWQILAAKYRSGGAVIISKRLNLPPSPVNMSNLVTSFSAKDLPREKGKGIEVDLGRNVNIGLVKLSGKLQPGFEIFVSEKSGDIGKSYFRELDYDWRQKHQSSGGLAEYFGEPIKGRYVRIVNRLGLPSLSLERIEIYAVAGS
ncbi:MAG: hypothetical protein ABL949_03920 [Fimbriimonadaceae bacterium]